VRGAGGGRPRKPEGTTRHRNAPTRHDIVVYADARVVDVPEPPIPLQGLQLAAWKHLWAEPVATLWSTADVSAIARMVALQTSAQVFQAPGLLAELRQLEDRFLLNPYARAQQRIVIVDPPDEQVEAEPVRYGHLRAMPGGQTG
jgi:hypothetical protein